MCQLVLVLLAMVAGYAAAATIERCCTQKMVGGVNYTLVDDTTSTGKWGCHSDCIFERVGMEGSRICFKSGDLEVVCQDECVFPNSLYNGTAFSTLYSFSTLGLQNHTDCQKLCKDHNKINDNNQKKCNYWDFSQLMHSPYTSNCDMYENVQGHRDTGKGTFRGPINEYCPYSDSPGSCRCSQDIPKPFCITGVKQNCSEGFHAVCKPANTGLGVCGGCNCLNCNKSLAKTKCQVCMDLCPPYGTDECLSCITDNCDDPENLAACG